jgi:transcriptional regulator with XRE-family HTH domain
MALDVKPEKWRVRLAKRRRVLGLSQQEFAMRVAASIAAVRTWEQGRGKSHSPNVHTALRIARVLNMTVENLFGED